MTHSHLGLDGAFLELNDVLGRVELRRAADGVLWPLRCEVTLPSLPPNPSGAVAYCLSEVSARLELVRQDAPPLWLADSLPRLATYHRFDTSAAPVDMQFHLSSAAVACLEATREGRALRIGVHFHAHLHRVGSYIREPDGSVPRLLRASVGLEVARDAWVTALRGAQVAQTVVLEVPLPNTVPTEYSDSLRAMQQAYRALEAGGKAGWQACARDVRTALEKWPGPKATGAVTYDRSMDLEARMAILREAVRIVTHDAHHQLEDHWCRADALALFSAAASLLAREVHGA